MLVISPLFARWIYNFTKKIPNEIITGLSPLFCRTIIWQLYRDFSILCSDPFQHHQSKREYQRLRKSRTFWNKRKTALNIIWNGALPQAICFSSPQPYQFWWGYVLYIQHGAKLTNFWKFKGPKSFLFKIFGTLKPTCTASQQKSQWKCWNIFETSPYINICWFRAQLARYATWISNGHAYIVFSTNGGGFETKIRGNARVSD